MADRRAPRNTFRENTMSKALIDSPIKRRTLLKAGLAIGAMQVASPFVVKSLADEPIKIGLDNPLTGTYAALGKNELIGAKLALEHINAKGGILGRKAELLVEDSTSGDAGTAVEKARKLIDRDQVNFLVGNINSALAQAIANVSFEKNIFHVVPGGHLTPLGTTDFSSYLIKAQAANPDVIIFLQAGDDAVNALKQAVQFGLDKKFHLAGAQQELEVLLGLPPEARIGTWVFEWYWKQPNVPHVSDFVADVRKASGGHVPTARTWFGYAAIWTCALAAAQVKSLDAMKMARAMQGFKLPPEVALMPDGAFFRAGQGQ